MEKMPRTLLLCALSWLLLGGDVKARGPRAGGLGPALPGPDGRSLSLDPERLERLAPDEGPFSPRPLPRHGPRPWKPRVRRGIDPRGRGLVDLRRWPDEPAAPTGVDEVKLAGALEKLATRPLPRPYLRRLAGWFVRYGSELEVDPFLLAALAQDQSQLRPRRQTPYGVGLLAIQPSMHGARIRDGHYRYGVLVDGVWQPRQLAVPRFPFTREALLQPEASIYFGAAILRVAREQCPAIDHYFRSVPHRSPVSHVIWGDPVRGAGIEDRVLRERRRLIGYYLGVPPFPRGRFRSILLHCPLDGAPRKVTGVIGDDREGGKRHHTGVDFDSTLGEPVRAVAPGEVTLAGVDWGRNELHNLDPKVARLLPRLAMGPRGLLVMIDHRDGLSSTYMHLSAYTVRSGERVRGGQLIGYVGRTGIRESPPHLHFDMRHEGQFIDPLEFIKAYVIPPSESYVGRRKAVVQRQRRLLRFRARRQAILRRLHEGAARGPRGVHAAHPPPRPSSRSSLR